MKNHTRRRFDWFSVVNGIILSLAAILCIIPFINMIAISFSSGSAVRSGLVKLWPVDFSLNAYSYIAGQASFWKATVVSVKRLLLGTTINMLLIITMAYPLSKEKTEFKARTAYVWYLFFTTLFGGGLIPTFMIINDTGLMDSMWALVLPGAVQVFNIILLLNFFRQLPKEMEEAAWVDGVGHLGMLWRIYVPTSTPALATLALFVIVGHWNAWFDGLIYMNHPDHYPLQTYLRNIVVVRQETFMDLTEMKKEFDLSSRTLTSAQIVVGALPILMVYPLLQKYFTKGIVLGSVKG